MPMHLAAQSSIDTSAIRNRVNQEYARRDSIVAAMKQKRIDDSIARVQAKIKLQQFRDSLTNARIQQKIKDSTDRALAKLKLLEEKRIKDSTIAAQAKKAQDSLARSRYIADSIRTAQLKVQDSIMEARRRITDSIKLAREDLREKREALKAYKASKGYKDSLEARKAFMKDSAATVRQAQLDKIRQEQKRITDSIASGRQRMNDSIAAIRQHTQDSISSITKKYNDSLKLARSKIKDSLVAWRKARADSLAAKRNKDGTAKDKPKTKEQQDKAFALKVHEKKQKEWSNEKLLKRKWTLPRKIYQNTVTRYNYYYNARRKYNESVTNLIKNNKDEYGKLINLRPYDVEKAGSSVASNMDTVIKKCSFSTQIHDPRSKWFDNLYFLMGKASFLKNDFDGAITTFQFVANEYKETPKRKPGAKKEVQGLATIENRKGIRKLRHHPIRNQALIWLAKSYVAAEQYSEAMSLLTTLSTDKNFPNRYKYELFLALAELEIIQKNEKEAIAALNQCNKYKTSKLQKSRTNFVLGQLLASQKEYKKSSEAFQNSLSNVTSPEMDFYTKLYIAQNAALDGTNINYAKNQLQKLVNDSKYARFKSHALNVLADLEAKSNIAKAIELLNKSIKNPENKDVTQKAIAFAKLGDIYYEQGSYVNAKSAYDSASAFGTTPPLDNLDEINSKKNVLTDVVEYVNTIRVQDSLLALSKKTDKEKRAIAKKALDDKKEQEKAKENANDTKVVALVPNNTGTNKSNWYFYNASLSSKGATDFQQKWGKRKLEDNWRRKAASSGAMAGNSDTEEGSDNDSKSKDNAASIEALLANVPNTPAKIAECNKKLEDAYFNLGITYYSRLNDFLHSSQSFDTLLDRFQNTSYKKQTYYGQFLNFTKLNDIPQANQYKALLQSEFPESEFAALAVNAEASNTNKKKEQNILMHYENAYMAYTSKEYRQSYEDVRYATTQFKGNGLIPKYELLGALCMAGLQKMDSCKLFLELVVANYPNTNEQKRASEILSYMNNAKSSELSDSTINNQIAEGTNSKSGDKDMAESTIRELESYEGKGVFNFEPSAEHFVMVFVKNVDGRAMGLKAAVGDYNLLKHSTEGYSVGMNMLSVKQSVITIHVFNNSVFAKKYMNDFAKEKLIFNQYAPSEYEIFLISSDNYVELLKSRDIFGYIKYYKKNYK